MGLTLFQVSQPTCDFFNEHADGASSGYYVFRAITVYIVEMRPCLQYYLRVSNMVSLVLASACDLYYNSIQRN